MPIIILYRQDNCIKWSHWEVGDVVAGQGKFYFRDPGRFPAWFLVAKYFLGILKLETFLFFVSRFKYGIGHRADCCRQNNSSGFRRLFASLYSHLRQQNFVYISTVWRYFLRSSSSIRRKFKKKKTVNNKITIVLPCPMRNIPKGLWHARTTTDITRTVKQFFFFFFRSHYIIIYRRSRGLIPCPFLDPVNK